MLLLKNLIKVLVAFVSFASVAGSLGSDCLSPSQIICTPVNWGFAADALYLQPSTTANSYTYTGQTNAQGVFSTYPNPWAWGYRLQGFYHDGLGRDVTINWTHFAPSSSKTLPGEPITLSSNPRWDAVNVELGQMLQFAVHKRIRLHGGVEYARIDNTSVNQTLTSLSDLYASQVTTYNGFGPRLGLDLFYLSDYGFTFYTKGAMAVLAGTTQFNAYSIATEQGGIFASLRDGATTSIVPELEGRLGATYDYVLPQGRMVFDLGWLWVNYFNVEDYFNVSLTDVLNGDFAVLGVYFGLKWQGNAL